MSLAEEVPADAEAATERLRVAYVPDEVVAVTATLQHAGHAAVLAGGAVRDVLLGLDASDWDLATSATPDEVQDLFPRTVPTGLAHGTITVLVRDPSAAKHVPVEVTTFRGEGAYVDGRRPTEVTFLRDLEADLARRDFTVNAFAWDPVACVFTDPFAGLQDLRDGWIRAVGEPEARFAEDGLRTMRAVRFCATRSLNLEPRTEDAIAGALAVLDMVSRERVLIELTKLLGAPEPSRGLRPMVRTGMWDHVFPPLDDGARVAAIAAVDALPADVGLRLARLLWPLAGGFEDGRAAALEAVSRLKPSKELRRRVESLWGPAVNRLAAAQGPVQVREAASALGRPHVFDALHLLGVSDARRAEVHDAVDGAALSVGELAIAGGDLVAANVCKPGRELGELLRSLLAEVVLNPSLNDPALLMTRARALVASRV